VSDPHNLVLIVEDEENIRFVLRALLESMNVQTVTAENGEEALALLERGPLPALIILDMLMPVMSGWEFAQKLRARYGHRIPVLVMTAASDAAGRAAAIEAESFMSKPFSVGELEEKLKQFHIAA
jgi:two-component system chemotaxis response regulator CheY